MTTIEYEKSKFVKEKKYLKLEDTKNLFFSGKNSNNGQNTFFGIWENENYLVIVTLLGNDKISYEYSKDKNIYTDNYIKEYLENNNYIDGISKGVFKKQFQNILRKLEI